MFFKLKIKYIILFYTFSELKLSQIILKGIQKNSENSKDILMKYTSYSYRQNQIKFILHRDLIKYHSRLHK
ncbi:hypothetical protein BpHYR1_004593 [Brachionus plicatilis]|uniref:Uncharacterized protein n=1 Tax=Brachionus plicatilis TaxID=10195 RepID=A0A3M7PC41_BRAPC|nr:hypothetical protein BpHYR1_004593 [Brachionus plicatilis]